jgi:hypothetical protein
MFRNSLILCSTLLLFVTSISSLGQSFTAVDSASVWPRHAYVVLNDSHFPIHHVFAQRTEKSASPMPSVSVEIYNLLVPAAIVHQMSSVAKQSDSVFNLKDTLLISLSILPNNKGKISWIPIDMDTIPVNHLLSLTDVVRDGKRRVELYRLAGNPKDHLLTSRINLFPIVKLQGRFWTPSTYVLTEYFLIRSYVTKSLESADYVVINDKSPTVPFDAPWRDIRELLPKKGNYKYSTAMGIVLSSKQRGIAEFWSRPEVNVSHPGLRHFGVGVFEYKPGIGLVSGKYAYYFHELNPLDSQIFFDHIVVDGKTVLR